MQAHALEIVARIDDDGQLVRWQHARQSQRQLGAADTAT